MYIACCSYFSVYHSCSQWSGSCCSSGCPYEVGLRRSTLTDVSLILAYLAIVFLTFILYIYVHFSPDIPLVVSVACYTRMLLVLRQSERKSKLLVDFQSQSIHKLRLAQLNVFKTCLMVLISFVICNMTLQSAVFLFIFGYYKTLSSNHFTFGYLLVLLNSCLNPFIYATLYTDDKQQVHKLIGRASNVTHHKV